MRIAANVGCDEAHTPAEISEQVRRDIECSLAHFAANPEEIDDRLEQLEHEWPIERTLQAQAAGAMLTGLVLGVLRGRKWLGLSALSGYFLMRHALRGWRPAVSLNRRLGLRTAHEIEVERAGLKALRGDFRSVMESHDPAARASAAFQAAFVGEKKLQKTASRREAAGVSLAGASPDQIEDAGAPSTLGCEPGRSAAGGPRGHQPRKSAADRPGLGDSAF